jgi:serine/threonine protein kinase
MRFRCQFCLSLIETSLKNGAPLDCKSCGRKTFVPKSPFEQNCVIDDFVISEKIGKGSVGTVYKAVQLSLERQVALKILAPELTNPKVTADFLREARAAAKLIHANLVQSFAVGEENGVCFMAMNYISGESLKAKLLREGRISVDEALHIVQQVAEALYYAWQEAKLIHRDVKPDNIMITAEGVVKLTDLGLAINQAEWVEDMEISGSPSYMSPEQFAGEKLDLRSDIYSLGITLYQMLSGELPFKAETFQAVAQQHFNDTAVPLHRLGLGISLRVSNLVKKMMEKLPDDRFRDMEALIKEIWHVRQTTAPNKYLVPDVHTISIARLDYQLQSKSAQNQEKEQAQPHAHVKISENTRKLKNRRDWLFWSMVTIFPFPFIILIAAVIIHASNKEPDETAFIEDRVALLEKKLANPNMPPTALAVEATRIMAIFPDERTQKQDVLYWKLKNYITSLESTKKAAEFEEKADYVKSLEFQLKELLSTKAGNDNKLAGEIKKTDSRIKAAESTIADMTDKIKELGNKIKDEEKQKLNLATVISKQQAAHEKYWKADILSNLYKQFRADDYARAEAYLTYKRSLHMKDYSAWFNSYIEWIKHLRELDEYFDTGNSNVVGKNLEGHRITMVNYGNIYFEEKGGVIKSRNWHEFSAQGLYDLLQKAKPELAGNRKVFDADIACLKGNIFSPEVIEGRPYIKELCLAVIDSTIESILIVAVYDKNQAAAAADNLLTMFRNSEFMPVIKARLGTLINQI